MRRLAIAAVLTAAVAAGPLAPPATAGHVSRSCGVIAKGSKDFRVKARGVTCRFARKWSRAYLRSRSRPRGWRCSRSDNPRIPFYCERRSRSYYVRRL